MSRGNPIDPLVPSQIEKIMADLQDEVQRMNSGSSTSGSGGSSKSGGGSSGPEEQQHAQQAATNKKQLAAHVGPLR